MNQTIKSALENINIAPLETCNLHCRYCYTQKNKNILTNDQILKFIDRYQNFLKENSEDTIFCGLERRRPHSPDAQKFASRNFPKNLKLKSVLLCGGEVFTLPDFPKLVNQLIQKDLFVTIISNGTIDRLSEIKDPKNCQLLVSLDGPKEIHDQNRGEGNFDKTINYIKHAQELGFPIEILFLVTKDSYPHKDSFNVLDLEKTYMTDRLFSLTLKQVLDIKQNYKTYPAKNFGCFQLCVQADGSITGCCETRQSLGTINDDPATYVANFIKSLSKCNSCKKCDGCCDPDFFCGYKKELKVKTCQEVVELFK